MSRQRRPHAIRTVAPQAAALLALLASTPPGIACPAASEIARVDDVPAGDRLHLADGRVIALAGIEMPRRLGRAAITADADREAAARAALAGHLSPGTIGLAVLGGADRRGHIPARVIAGGVDLAEMLLAAGHVRLRPGASATPCRAALRAAEALARTERRGLWSVDEFRLRAADDTDLPRLADSYAVVEGRVVSIGRAGQRRYINFSRDRRAGFTVVVETRNAATFAAAGFDIDRLRGQKLRVRGWLTTHDGTEMILNAPEEMEWVDETRQPTPGANGLAAPD